MNPLLVWLVALPLLGAIVGAFVPARQARYWALLVSLLTLLVGLVLAAQFYNPPAAGAEGDDSSAPSAMLRKPAARGAAIDRSATPPGLSFLPTGQNSPFVLDSIGVKF